MRFWRILKACRSLILVAKKTALYIIIETKLQKVTGSENIDKADFIVLIQKASNKILLLKIYNQNGKLLDFNLSIIFDEIWVMFYVNDDLIPSVNIPLSKHVFFQPNTTNTRKCRISLRGWRVYIIILLSDSWFSWVYSSRQNLQSC